MKKQELILIFFALAFFLAHGIYSAGINSVTADEYVHLPVGYSVLKTGQADMDHRGSPPLARALLAVPLLFSNPVLNTKSPAWKNGEMYAFSWEFMKDNFKTYKDLFFYPRIVGVLFGMVLILCIAVIAGRIYGNGAGAAAAILAATAPEFLAHAPLVTTDFLGTGFFFVSFMLFAWVLEYPSLKTSALAGIALGCALLSKYTSLILIPIFIVITAIYLLPVVKNEHKKSSKEILIAVCGIFAVALFVICAAHGFKGVFVSISAMGLHSDFLVSVSSSFIGKIPIPLPSQYVNALDYLLIKKATIFTYFLNGETSQNGWPHYFIVAAALKYPVPILLLTLVSAASFFKKGVKLAERIMWVPILSVFVLFSFFLKVDNGVRYLLPIVPFLIVLSAGRISDMLSYNKSTPIKTAAVLLLAWHCVSFLSAPGNCLAYFNEIAGGTSGGRKYLAESNVDWGQNLIRLKNFTDKNDMAPLLLYNYGLTPSAAYEIHAGWVPCKPVRAVVAISVNYIYGLDPFQKRTAECFSWLSELEPVEVLGGGLMVYDTREAFKQVSDFPSFPDIGQK